MHFPGERPASFGLVGVILTVVSLIVLMIQFSDIIAPEEKSSATTIGEIAAEIRLSAQRTLRGEPAPPAPPPPPDYRQAITIAAIGLAGLGIVLGAVGLFRREPPRLPAMAMGIGISAIVMQYFFWVAVMFCGALILVAIINNIGDILE